MTLGKDLEEFANKRAELEGKLAQAQADADAAMTVARQSTERVNELRKEIAALHLQRAALRFSNPNNNPSTRTNLS